MGGKTVKWRKEARKKGEDEGGDDRRREEAE